MDIQRRNQSEENYSAFYFLPPGGPLVAIVFPEWKKIPDGPAVYCSRSVTALPVLRTQLAFVQWMVRQGMGLRGWVDTGASCLGSQAGAWHERHGNICLQWASASGLATLTGQSGPSLLDASLPGGPRMLRTLWHWLCPDSVYRNCLATEVLLPGEQLLTLAGKWVEPPSERARYDDVIQRLDEEGPVFRVRFRLITTAG